jgi:hypothetical protein
MFIHPLGESSALGNPPHRGGASGGRGGGAACGLKVTGPGVSSESETGQEPVEKGRDSAEGRRAVQQARHGTEQIPPEVARSRYRRDVQVHRSQVDDQAEEVEVQWLKVKIED